jgi:hypothetical protein
MPSEQRMARLRDEFRRKFGVKISEEQAKFVLDYALDGDDVFRMVKKRKAAS